MSRIIVAATPLAGHTSPMLQIAAALVGAGHEVAFIGGERFTDVVKAAGAQMYPLTGRAAYDDRRMSEHFPQRQSFPPGPPQLSYDFEHVFGDAIADQHTLLQRLLAEDPDQVLIADLLFLGAWPSALGSGLRPRGYLALAVLPLYVPSDDATPLGPVPVPSGADQVAANRAALASFEAAVGEGSAHVVDVLNRLGADTSDWKGFFDALYRLPDLVAQPTVPGFEFPRSDLPSHIRFVGPLPMTATQSFAPPPWWDELGTRPVVVVTQGTMANQDLGALVDPTIQALADQDVLVVAALGGREVSAVGVPLPANTRVESYIPFDQLLPHADVLVTNGGYGGVQVSLAAGCPVVIAGTTEDKPATAARIAFTGVGIDLSTERPTPEQIREAVLRILSDESFGEKVTALRKSYAEYDSLSSIVVMVEGAGKAASRRSVVGASATVIRMPSPG